MTALEFLGTGGGAIVILKVIEMGYSHFAKKSDVAAEEKKIDKEFDMQMVKTLLDERKNDADDRRLEVNKLKEEVDALRKELHVAQSLLIEHQNTINTQQIHMIQIESATYDHPFPWWLKDEKGKMIRLNKAYEDQFLIPRGYTSTDYIGHFDIAIWPADIAEAYRKNDEEVMKTKKMWIGYEEISRPDGSTYKVGICKYPRYHGMLFLGIAGVAIPEDFFDFFNQ